MIKTENTLSKCIIEYIDPVDYSLNRLELLISNVKGTRDISGFGFVDTYLLESIKQARKRLTIGYSYIGR